MRDFKFEAGDFDLGHPDGLPVKGVTFKRAAEIANELLQQAIESAPKIYSNEQKGGWLDRPWGRKPKQGRLICIEEVKK